jgi:hypothetical protein
VIVVDDAFSSAPIAMIFRTRRITSLAPTRRPHGSSWLGRKDTGCANTASNRRVERASWPHVQGHDHSVRPDTPSLFQGGLSHYLLSFSECRASKFRARRSALRAVTADHPLRSGIEFL